MVHPPKIYNRIFRVIQAKLHSYLSRKRLIQLHTNEDNAKITLKGPIGLVDIHIDEIIPSIVQQLRKDIGLSSLISVAEENWGNFLFKGAIRAQI
jgi:hypothetical protein